MKNSENYTPKHSLIVYEHSNEYFIEIADFKWTNLGYKPGAYSPLDIDTMSRLTEAFHVKQKKTYSLKGILTPNILYFNTNPESFKIIWKVPAGKRKLYFKNNLRIPDGEAYLPELIFMVSFTSLFVFAVHKRKLYRAPFHNVNDVGLVCMGNVKQNKNLTFIEDIIKDFEKGFFNSYFSETHGKPINGNINTFWKQAITKNLKFEHKVLIKSNRTINGLINGKN